MSPQPLRQVLVIAHRGASGERPENTRSAFALAIEQGADMIETDLHLSRDGVVVLHHDASLRRLGRAERIGDLDAEDLRGLDASAGRAAPETMPELLAVLDEMGSQVEWNLELKVDGERAYAGLEARAIEAVRARGLLGRMLFSSFSDAVLDRLRAEEASARIAVLASPRSTGDVLERAARVAAEAIHPHVSLVSAELVEAAHARGLFVYPYTENDPEGMKRLLRLGVDGIITNHPASLRALLAEADRPGA